MKDSLLDPEHRDFEEGLRRAGRDVHMSPAARGKTLAALGLSAAGVTTVSTAQASGASFWTTKAGLLSTVGTVVAGSAIVAVTMGLPAGGEGTGEGDLALSARSVTPPPPRVDDSEGDDRAQDVAPEGLSAPPAVEPSRASGPTKPSGHPSKRVEREVPQTPVPEASLGEEVAHLGKVEAALGAADPAGALKILEDYRARFTKKRLGLEAEVLTIQALHDSGAHEAARVRAKRFLERHPSSPLGARAKQYVR